MQIVFLGPTDFDEKVLVSSILPYSDEFWYLLISAIKTAFSVLVNLVNPINTLYAFSFIIFNF